MVGALCRPALATPIGSVPPLTGNPHR